MPSFEFEVWCSCGKGLCRQTDVNGKDVTVEPCKDCLENATQESHISGYKEGYDKGYNDGQADM